MPGDGFAIGKVLAKYETQKDTYVFTASEYKTTSENHGYSTDCTDLARIGQSVLIRAKSVL